MSHASTINLVESLGEDFDMTESKMTIKQVANI